MWNDIWNGPQKCTAPVKDRRKMMNDAMLKV